MIFPPCFPSDQSGRSRVGKLMLRVAVGRVEIRQDTIRLDKNTGEKEFRRRENNMMKSTGRLAVEIFILSIDFTLLFESSVSKGMFWHTRRK